MSNYDNLPLPDRTEADSAAGAVAWIAAVLLLALPGIICGAVLVAAAFGPLVR